MDKPIVQSDEPVLLLGAGAVTDAVLDDALGLAKTVVAADGGARRALDRGLPVEAVIGDMDSLDAEALGALPPERVHRIAEQETTDFEKALVSVAAPLVLAAGFTGGRLDHELAACNALVRHPDRRTILLGEEDLCFHLPGEIALALPAGARLSLFPMREVRCRSTGLRWPTDHLEFSPWGRVGTSNETAADAATLSPSGPGMLAILPRMALRAAVDALAP